MLHSISSQRRRESQHAGIAQQLSDRALRNPLSHFRAINDPTSLSRRAIDTRIPAEEHLRADALFAIGTVVRLLSLPAFRLGD
jgi:hypothetical protein